MDQRKVDEHRALLIRKCRETGIELPPNFVWPTLCRMAHAVGKPGEVKEILRVWNREVVDRKALTDQEYEAVFGSVGKPKRQSIVQTLTKRKEPLPRCTQRKH